MTPPPPNVPASVAEAVPVTGAEVLSNIPTSQGQFKLISVSFKEAALDSPSFRASINHLDRQIDNIDKWLHALVTSIHKIPKHIKELQGYYNSFLEHLVPTFLQDGLIDQEYTVSSMQITLEGLKRLWGNCLNSLTVDSYIVDNLYVIVSKNIAHYRELRVKFEKCQEKHDKYLALYVSTPKTKDPLSTIEDAKQFYAVRRSYIHESLDLVIELSSLGSLLDRTLVRLSSDLWTRKRSVLSGVPFSTDESFFKETYTRVQKIQGWCDSYAIAIEKLSSDMLAARNQVEESSIHQFAPSTDLNDYRSSSINQRSLRDVDENGLEKHGYLFMKTWGDKSSKPIWVRRWAFIKSGVFGLLVLSPTKTYVQETDKIGVLLCNVKYNPNEERRFCFEVKTSGFAVVFQAETLIELKSWLKVFENEKSRIMNGMDEDVESFNIASGRYPPIISELASTANTTIDREFTNTRIVHSSGHIITSSTLASHIQKNERSFQKHVYYQIPQIRPPTMTDTTKSSIIAYSIATATSVPTALKANIWGSVNWGIYYLHNALHEGVNAPLPVHPETDLIEQQQQMVDSGMFYPDYYSPSLIPLDIQMRALFETAIEPGEYCLISFRCIWSPNSRQELSGRCFITTNHIYFYMQALGFVALFKGYVGHLVSVDYSVQKYYDFLRIHSINGSIKMKLFIDDAKSIKRKLAYLIANRVSEKPKLLRDLISDLDKIDADVLSEKRTAQQAQQIRVLSKNLHQAPEKLTPGLDNFPLVISNPEKLPSLLQGQDGAATSFRTDFSDTYLLISERQYAISPKALFHTLLGDNSVLLQDQVFGTLEFLTKKAWAQNSDGQLERSYISRLSLFSKRSDIKVRQVVEAMYDDEYYTFLHQRATYTFNIGSQFSVEYRFVIIGAAGKHCRLYTYSKLKFATTSIFNGFIKALCHSVARRYHSSLHRRIHECITEIGNHGIIVKSIYLYGQLSHTDVLDVVGAPPLTNISFFVIARMYVTQYMISVLSRVLIMSKFLGNFVLSVLESIRMQWTLLVVIGLLLLSNMYLAGKTSVSYWAVHRSDVLAKQYLQRNPVMLQRAVYIKDTQDWVTPKVDLGTNTTASSSRCMETFSNKSFMNNFAEPMFWDDIYGDVQSRSVAQSLRRQHQDIGVQRHDLLVKLRMLNTLDNEIAQAEWHNWLASEMRRCEYIKYNILDKLKDGGELSEGLSSGIVTLAEFCQDCAKEMQHLELL